VFLSLSVCVCVCVSMCMRVCVFVYLSAFLRICANVSSFSCFRAVRLVRFHDLLVRSSGMLCVEMLTLPRAHMELRPGGAHLHGGSSGRGDVHRSDRKSRASTFGASSSLSYPHAHHPHLLHPLPTRRVSDKALAILGVTFVPGHLVNLCFLCA
jgi:hypothetical protein